LRVWFVVAFIPPTIHTKGVDMTRGLDHEKRRAWAAKLERFRASGLTIAKFCAEEKIHVQTFHYWARRIRAAQPSRSTPNNAVAPAGDSSGADARVHFVLADGVQVSIPANCLEAIRCLAGCIQQSNSAPPVSFHQVLLRKAAQGAN
jgi:hypothetical protein